MSDPDRLDEITQWLATERAAYPNSNALPHDMADWLVGEVERQRGLLERWMIEYGKRVEGLRDLLARLEWSCRWASAKAVGICPECGAYEPGPHDPGCWLAAALAGNANEPPPEGEGSGTHPLA